MAGVLGAEKGENAVTVAALWGAVTKQIFTPQRLDIEVRKDFAFIATDYFVTRAMNANDERIAVR